MKRFDSENADIIPTTWNELIKRYLLLPVKGFPGWFTLTAYGYRHALELAGMDQVPQMREKLGLICKCLKDKMKGRHQSINVEVATIAAETGFDPGFLYNVIEAKLIDHWFNQQGPRWVSPFAGVIIHVPEDFGLPTLPS